MLKTKIVFNDILIFSLINQSTANEVHANFNIARFINVKLIKFT